MHPNQARALSSIERLVLRRSATGLTLDEVAEELGLDTDETWAHLVAAMSALEARSKLEAVVFALRAGLIELG